MLVYKSDSKANHLTYVILYPIHRVRLENNNGIIICKFSTVPSVFPLIFSSPEPKALRWAIIIPMTLLLSTFSNIFSSETTGPIELKFHMTIP